MEMLATNFLKFLSFIQLFLIQKRVFTYGQKFLDVFYPIYRYYLYDLQYSGNATTQLSKVLSSEYSSTTEKILSLKPARQLKFLFTTDSLINFRHLVYNLSILIILFMQFSKFRLYTYLNVKIFTLLLRISNPNTDKKTFSKFHFSCLCYFLLGKDSSTALFFQLLTTLQILFFQFSM